MDEVLVTNEPSIRDQLTKMLLGVTAGFIAGKLVESAYDKFVIERRNK